MEKMYGLYLAGTVKERRKREIIKDGKTIEIVTYSVCDDDDHTYYVDAYAPTEYLERDKYVKIPVYIKPYIKKNKEPSYTINVRPLIEEKNYRGEVF